MQVQHAAGCICRAKAEMGCSWLPERTRILEVVKTGEQGMRSPPEHSACSGGLVSKQRGETGAGETCQV